MHRVNRLSAALRQQRQQQRQRQRETIREREASRAVISPTPEPSLHDYRPSSVHDVYHTLFVLRQRLPHELAVQILDTAEYWTATRHSTHTGPANLDGHAAITIRKRPQGEVVLRTPALDASQSRRVRRVVFTACSHDQGWSDVAADQGTERAWTWFQGRVETADGSSVAGPAPEHVYDWATGVDRVMPRWPAGGPSPVQAWMDARLMTNPCAVGTPGEKAAEWRWDAEDAVEAEAVRALRAGQRLALTGHAVFRGWVNHVQRADITVYFGHVR